jgi:photosystem II stability/assembly factor-like uncharacterized protein
MKPIISMALAIMVVFSANSQAWRDNLPQEKLESGNLKLSDYQEAFNEYWEPYNVENGYYMEDGVRRKAPGWKQFKRWEWKAEYLVNGKGEFPATTTASEMEKYNKAYGGSRNPSGNWYNIGYSITNGGYEGVGRVNCIAFHPTNSNHFWLGAPAGGLWETIDGGANWAPLTDANTVLGVSAIAVTSNYSISQTMYIGTGDRDGWNVSALGSGNLHDNEGIGVLKTTDGGATWVSSLYFPPDSLWVVYDLLIDPTNNSVLYAATGKGIYETTDAGVSWTQITPSVYNDLEFQPGNSSVFYGAFINSGYVTKFTRVGGIPPWTWSSIQLSTTAIRTELAVSANNSSVVYAVTVNPQRGLGAIYKSTDWGGTYTNIFSGTSASNNILGYGCTPTTFSGQGDFDLFITANPTNVNDVYVGGINVWRSTDGGYNWSIKSHWNGTCSGTVTEVHCDQHCCEFNGSTVYIGNDGGIYKSTDNGTTWNDISNSLVINQIYRIGLAKYDPFEYIIGLQDNGTHLHSGGSWVMDAVMGGDGMECFIDPTDNNVQFGEYQNGGLRKTVDHWANDMDITTGLSGSAAWVTPFIMDPNDHNTIYVGYENVFKSTDQGNNWSQISTWGGGSNTIRSLAVAPSNSSVIYAATLTSIYRTIDGGASWSQVTSNLPVTNGNITYVTVKHTDPNTAWVTIGGYNSDAVYETTNGGGFWTNISSGLPNLPAMSIVQNVYNTNMDELYVAMSQGVWVKYGPAMWIPFKNGLPNAFCTELEIYYHEPQPYMSLIRVGTFGRGIWESPVPMTDFSANPTTPPDPGMIVMFTDQSTNAPYLWQWSFNPPTIMYAGGTNPNSQHPHVHFQVPGAYDVTLTVTNPFGNFSRTKTAYIHMGIMGLWTGQTSTNWSTATNWDNHYIPDASVPVFIDSLASVQWPTYTGDFTIGTQCLDINLLSNTQFNVTGDITIPSGKQFNCTGNPVISLTGDWVNYGTFNYDSSLVQMTGPSNSMISGIDTTFSQLGTTMAAGYFWNSSYFDVTSIGPEDIEIYAFDIHCLVAGPLNVEIWYTNTPYVGNTNNPGVWSQLGNTLMVNSNGSGVATYVVPDTEVTIPSGATYGFFISCYDAALNGAIMITAGSNTYTNSDISVYCNDASWTNQPGGGSSAGYLYNGAVYYNYTTGNPLDFFDLEIGKNNANVQTHGDVQVKNVLDVKPGADLFVSPGDSLKVKK